MIKFTTAMNRLIGRMVQESLKIVLGDQITDESQVRYTLLVHDVAIVDNVDEEINLPPNAKGMGICTNVDPMEAAALMLIAAEGLSAAIEAQEEDRPNLN